MRLPRGWWRPVLAYGAFVLMLLALSGAREPSLYLGLPFAVAPFVAFVILRNAVPVSRFLRGLQEAGGPVVVVHDELTWLGERKLRARTPEGDWRVECWAGNSIELRVRGPRDKRIRRVEGSALRAGREAAAALRAG